MASQVLYRFWSDADELLYVGITARPWERWKQHRAEKAWWEEVAKVTIENFATRAEVKAAETVAIKTEGPRYNIAEVPKATVVDDPEETWDGKHVPQIAFVDSWLYCSCRPPDWSTQPERLDFGSGPIKSREDLDERYSAYHSAEAEWFQKQADLGVYIRPEDYADHVIESVSAERWAEAMEAARSNLTSSDRKRQASVKFILKVWPEYMHTQLPRSWQRYARQWLDQGATREDIKEALDAAADAFLADRTERPWNYAGGVIARKVRELHAAADDLMARGGN